MEGVCKMIGGELLRFQREQKYLTLDTETTGLNTVYSLPFQVSFSTYTQDNNLEFHDYFIHWDDLKMSAGAKAITKFDETSYHQKAQPAKEILDIVESYIFDPQYKIAAHNYIAYDSLILGAWRRALGMKPIYDYLYQPYKVYDTVAMSKMYKKGIKPDISTSNNWLAHQYRVLDFVEKGLKTSLSTMTKELNIETDVTRLHTADYDIELNAKVFKKLIWQIEV
jgi:DNA polymerase III alpha subunit (gram-positive type)